MCSPQDIKAASLRTLTSIVHLERTPKLSSIIDCTGTASYHGFLPVLVRNCIQAMIGGLRDIPKMGENPQNSCFWEGLTHPNALPALPDPSMEPYPHQFATALFSFLYHLASYDAGGEALVSCGMMEALLKVSVKPPREGVPKNIYGPPPSHLLSFFCGLILPKR